MSRTTFEYGTLALGAVFAACFFTLVVPPLLESGDIVGAFAAGFVNPYSTGYSIDVIICAFILVLWMVYERASLGIRHGWVVVPLSFAPGWQWHLPSI